MKKQILLQLIFPIFLSNVFSMQGMMSAQKARSSLLQNVGRYRGLTKAPSLRKPVSNVVFQEKAYNPSSMWIQKRSYSDSTPKHGPIPEHSSIPKQTSLWNWFASFFNQKPIDSDQQNIALSNKRILTKELKTKGIYGIMNEVLYPKNIMHTTGRTGYEYNTRVFDENNLESAKEKISRILELNHDYKTLIVRKTATAKPEFSRDDLRDDFGTKLSLFYSEIGGTWPYVFEGTILDEVLYTIFSGEYSYFFSTKVEENELRANYIYIKLAQWLIDQGVKINPNNEKNYVIGYGKCLMSAYKNLYEPKPFDQETFSPENVDSFKKIFATLDPILEKLISNPELKQELHQMQQERREIETNPQAYREKLAEQDRRDAYISRKAKILEFEYISRTGDWDKGSHEFRKYVEFDESEYQEWKKTGFLRGEKEKLEQERQWQKQWESEENNFDQEASSSYQYQSKDNAIQLLKKDLGLADNTSAIDVKKKFRDVSKLNHPDTRKEETATMTQEEYKKLSSLYSSASESLDRQAREEAAQRRKATQQKAQEAKE